MTCAAGVEPSPLRAPDRHLAEFIASLETPPSTATATTASARRGRTTPGTANRERRKADEMIIGKYEATIYPEGDGWTGAISLGFDAAGRRRRVKRKGR